MTRNLLDIVLSDKFSFNTFLLILLGAMVWYLRGQLPNISTANREIANLRNEIENLNKRQEAMDTFRNSLLENTANSVVEKVKEMQYEIRSINEKLTQLANNIQMYPNFDQNFSRWDRRSRNSTPYGGNSPYNNNNEDDFTT